MRNTQTDKDLNQLADQWDDIASVELSPTYILIYPQHEAPDIIIKAEQDPEDYLRTAIRQQADQNKIPVTHVNG